jgi:hypothetical protein
MRLLVAQLQPEPWKRRQFVGQLPTWIVAMQGLPNQQAIMAARSRAPRSASKLVAKAAPGRGWINLPNRIRALVHLEFPKTGLHHARWNANRETTFLLRTSRQRVIPRITRGGRISLPDHQPGRQLLTRRAAHLNRTTHRRAA